MAFLPQPLFNYLTESILHHVYQRVRLPLTPPRKRLIVTPQNHSPSCKRPLWLVHGARCVPVVLALMYLFGSRSHSLVPFLQETS
jgi:hypothetical protein